MIIPNKIKKGDSIRVITPARSIKLPFITEESINVALKRFEEMNLKVTFGKNVNVLNQFNSSSVEERIEDLHDAFKDQKVKAIISVIGGYNSGELLDYLDYNLIKKKPKILCGYSDITAILNAIHSKTSLLTYYGPHFFDFGNIQGADYTIGYFKKCLFIDSPFRVLSSEKWSNDKWSNCQKRRKFVKNYGPFVVNNGKADGTILGGNLVTFCSLSGTPFFPGFKDTVLFIEEDEEEHLFSFNRNLTSLTNREDFSGVKAIVFGRFQPGSKITEQNLFDIVKNNKKLQKIPIIGGVDFGHTTPRLTIPIGGKCKIEVEESINITILEH